MVVGGCRWQGGSCEGGGGGDGKVTDVAASSGNLRGR